jgi:peptidase C39-like protein
MANWNIERAKRARLAQVGTPQGAKMTKAANKTATKKKKKAPAPERIGAGKILAFVMQQEEQDNWCWAAVAASVGDYYAAQETWEQCEVANLELLRDDCCGDGAAGPCNVYGYLASALNRVHCLQNWQIAVRVAFAVVVGEINAGRPVCVRVAWRGGGAHFVVITGYDDPDPNVARVLIQDPYFQHQDIAWSDFLNVYRPVNTQPGDWTDTYLTQDGSP